MLAVLFFLCVFQASTLGSAGCFPDIYFFLRYFFSSCHHETSYIHPAVDYATLLAVVSLVVYFIFSLDGCSRRWLSLRLLVCTTIQAALSHLSGAGWWLSHMFGHVLGPLVRASKAAARVLPRPPKRPKPDPSSGGGNASSKSRFGRQASSKVEPEEAEVWPPHVEPRSTELGVLLHQVKKKTGRK
jgi:hypothetical protein